MEAPVAQYAIAFDLDTKAMKQDGLSEADKVRIYQQEIPNALNSCGFSAHPQGSLYHTETEQDPIAAIMKLQGALVTGAPNFCRYVRRVHVFRMEEWSDVTNLLANRAAASAPDGEEELEEQEDMALSEAAPAPAPKFKRKI
jgi:virulence-associated protein VapD